MQDAQGNPLAVGQKVFVACRAYIAEKGIKLKAGRITHIIPAAKEGPKPEPETAMIDETFLFKKNQPVGRFTSEHIFPDAVSASDWAKAQARVMLDEAAQKYEVFQKNCRAVLGEK